MSDGAHDNPYACLRRNKTVTGEYNADTEWFRCPECKTDCPKDEWAAANLHEELAIRCKCGIEVELPKELPR